MSCLKNDDISVDMQICECAHVFLLNVKVHQLPSVFWVYLFCLSPFVTTFFTGRKSNQTTPVLNSI